MRTTFWRLAAAKRRQWARPHSRHITNNNDKGECRERKVRGTRQCVRQICVTLPIHVGRCCCHCCCWFCGCSCWYVLLLACSLIAVIVFAFLCATSTRSHRYFENEHKMVDCKPIHSKRRIWVCIAATKRLKKFKMSKNHVKDHTHVQITCIPNHQSRV